ncbi:MAG TPA: serine/threonine-protein kinase [Verrucomicrobiae bacterium]
MSHPDEPISKPPRREEALFTAAAGLSPKEQKSLLDRECAGDDSLRQRLNALLTAHEQPDALPPPPEVERPEPAFEDKLLGLLIGRYQLLERIGEGGCGVVYVAEQTEPVRRRVALKLIKPGMDTKQVVARFEAERQAMAMMDHPNIAKALDAGTADTGRPYFVMELVRGVKLTDYCDQNHLSTRERLELFIQVCQAVQDAHQKGIIHRDLKPSNILVTLHNGAPAPKIIDFGIAKAINNQVLTDKTIHTAFEQFIGTPAYMSPEQAQMSNPDVDTRTDIYSLGVLLYELLTGRTPFDSKELISLGLDAMRKTICEKEPPRPSTRLARLERDELTTTAKRRSAEVPKLIRQLSGDLDWISVKCLEKDRARRYGSAEALAADLRRHLNTEPVLARPPGKFYEFQKTVRRHKVGFAAATAIIIVLFAGILVSTWQAVRATRAQRAAMLAQLQADTARDNEAKLREQAQTEAARSAQVATFMKDMLKGAGPSVALGRDTTLLREILDQTARRLDTLKDQPDVEADLRETIGVVYQELSDFPQAEAMLQKSLALRRQLYGNENAPVANALNDLAETDRLQKRYVEAGANFRAALAMRRKLFGEENLDVAASLYGLANTLRGQKNQGVYASSPDEIEKDFREALAVRRKLLGEENLDVATSLVGLGVFLKDIDGHRPEAAALLREALPIQRHLLGNENPIVANTLQNLGFILSALPGGRPEGEALLREAVAMDKKLLGNSRDTVIALLQLSATVTNLSETIMLDREAEAMSERVVGVTNLQTIEAQRYLASALLLQDKFAEAEALTHEPPATRTAPALNAAAWALTTSPYPELRDGSNAVIFAENAVVATGRTNATFLDTLATAYAETGRFDMALAIEKEAISRLPGYTDGDFAQRLSLYESSLPYHNQDLLAQTVYFFALSEKAYAFLQAGRFAEAEPPAQDCLGLGEKLIPNDWRIFDAQSMLGGSLLGQKKYTEARPLLLSGYEGLKQSVDQTPDEVRQARLKEALERLAQFYQTTGQPEKAASLLR